MRRWIIGTTKSCGTAIKRLKRRSPLSRGADVEGLIGAGRHERSYFPHYLEPRKTSEKAPVRSSRKLGSEASRPGASTTWSQRWACPAFEEPSLELVQRH